MIACQAPFHPCPLTASPADERALYLAQVAALAKRHDLLGDPPQPESAEPCADMGDDDECKPPLTRAGLALVAASWALIGALVLVLTNIS